MFVQLGNAGFPVGVKMNVVAECFQLLSDKALIDDVIFYDKNNRLLIKFHGYGCIADIHHGKWCQKKFIVIYLIINTIQEDPRVRRSRNGNFRLTLGIQRSYFRTSVWSCPMHSLITESIVVTSE